MQVPGCGGCVRASRSHTGPAHAITDRSRHFMAREILITMNRSLRGLAVAAAALALLGGAGCNKLRARDQLNKGVQSYNNAKYEDAITHYQPRMEERAKLGLKPDEPLKDKKVCRDLAAKNGDVIKDGIDNLNKALQQRPDYDDAMAYLNLMYREKADLECDDPAARAADLKTADDWVDKTMATKKAKAEKQPGVGGIVQDQSSK